MQHTHDTTPRNPLARPLVALMHEARAVREAYHVAVALLHARQRQYDDLRARHARLLDELRRLRAHTMTADDGRARPEAA